MRSHQPVLFATVVDNQDPDAMGRVKLRLAWGSKTPSAARRA
ncbi:MAG: phage baseplate assembly protein V [Spirochaetales bacterium]|nr:phage baseplate assembly protein V [Spirochaetales bacterium]